MLQLHVRMTKAVLRDKPDLSIQDPGGLLPLQIPFCPESIAAWRHPFSAASPTHAARLWWLHPLVARPLLLAAAFMFGEAERNLSMFTGKGKVA